MKIQVKDVDWSRLRNRKTLRQYESPIARRSRESTPTHVVASLDLDDDEWEEFVSNLTGDYAWLVLPEETPTSSDYRNAVKVMGPDRTIYVEPKGSSVICVGFPKEKACSTSPESPKPPSETTSTGGPTSTTTSTEQETPSPRSEPLSDAPTATKPGDASPTAAKSAETAAETPAPEPAVQEKKATVPAAPPASLPDSLEGMLSKSLGSTPELGTTSDPSSLPKSNPETKAPSSTSSTPAATGSPMRSDETSETGSTPSIDTECESPGCKNMVTPEEIEELKRTAAWEWKGPTYHKILCDDCLW